MVLKTAEMQRRTVSFDDELFEQIEKERGKKTPIPSFSDFVADCMRERYGLQTEKESS